MKGEKLHFNQPQPDGSYMNDLNQRRARFVVGEQAWKQAYAEASFESLMQVLSQLASAAPQAVINLLDLVFDMHPTLPRKRAIVARIRSINGQADPDGKISPEQQAEQAQKAAIAKQQFDAQMAQMAADIAKSQAAGEKLSAEAMKTRLTAIYESAQAAQVLATLPEAAPIADELLRSSGFQDKAGGSQVIDAEMPQAPAQQMPLGEQPPMPELQQADGAQQGINTPAVDGVM
jgi:hypothetical protein